LKYSVLFTSIERVCHTIVWKALCLTIKRADRHVDWDSTKIYVTKWPFETASCCIP
jgi:hypothetical protein